MENFKINYLKDATLQKDNKLKLIYDCSSDTKIAEIEYIVNLNKPAQTVISRTEFAYETGHDAYRVQKTLPMYNPYLNIAFMFETDKAYEIRVKDRVKKMTVEDIEEQLGYKVEIVSK